MARVVTPAGVVAAQVWDRMEAQIGYLPFAEVAARYAGPEAIDLIGTYFKLGDVDALRALFASSGLEMTAVQTYSTRMRFDSIDDFVTSEVEATPLAEQLDDDVYRSIREDSRDALSQFEEENGVAIPVFGTSSLRGDAEPTLEEPKESRVGGYARPTSTSTRTRRIG